MNNFKILNNERFGELNNSNDQNENINKKLAIENVSVITSKITEEQNSNSDNENTDKNIISDKNEKKNKKQNYVFFENYSSKKHPFNFQTYKLIDGIIFFLFVIILPFAINIFVTYTFKKPHHSPIDANYDQDYLKQRLLLDGMTWLISAIILIYLWIKYGKKFVKDGGLIPFYFIIFMPFMINILDLFIARMPIYNTSSSDTQNLIGTIIQMIAEIICTVLILTTTKGLFKRIINTYKDNSFYLSVAIAVPLTLIATNLISKIGDVFGFTVLLSDNQDSLNVLLNTIPGTITLGIFTLIIAPITEELTTRHGIFVMTSNKWLGFFASFIYFSGMHVSEYGDWNDIFDYLGAAISLAFLFLVSNGNVTFTITTHSLINLIAYIAQIIQHYKK